MTDTKTGETFPAGTAAYRIDRSVRLLVRGFTDQVMGVEAHTDVEQAETAVRCTNRISRALHELEQALGDAAFLLTRNGLTAPGRDIAEEDRAVIELLGGLQDLAAGLKGNYSYNYDDRSAGYSEGQESAGGQLEDTLTSWAATRALKGRGGR